MHTRIHMYIHTWRKLCLCFFSIVSSRTSLLKKRFTFVPIACKFAFHLGPHTKSIAPVIFKPMEREFISKWNEDSNECETQKECERWNAGAITQKQLNIEKVFNLTVRLLIKGLFNYKKCFILLLIKIKKSKLNTFRINFI